MISALPSRTIHGTTFLPVSRSFLIDFSYTSCRQGHLRLVMYSKHFNNEEKMVVS